MDHAAKTTVAAIGDFLNPDTRLGGGFLAENGHRETLGLAYRAIPQ